MVRLFFLGFFIGMAVLAGVVLKGCQSMRGDASAGEQPLDIVVLPDGGTMLASPCTVRRELVDWLESSDGARRSFELSGQEFQPGTAEPTPESLGRVPKLVAMLRAYPDVHVVIVGHARASGNATADQRLSRARAQRLADMLRDGGVSTERLLIDARGAQDPLNPAHPTPQDERVSLILTRPDPSLEKGS